MPEYKILKVSEDSYYTIICEFLDVCTRSSNEHSPNLYRASQALFEILRPSLTKQELRQYEEVEKEIEEVDKEKNALTEDEVNYRKGEKLRRFCFSTELVKMIRAYRAL